MDDIFRQLLLQLILILLNAFFAATEIAVISLNEKKLKARAEDGDKKAVRMLKMIAEPTRFLSTIQIGITLAGFLGSAFAADNFANRLSGVMVRTFGIPQGYENTVNTIAVILITLILSFFTLVLGELVPKRIAMKHKEKLAERVCGIISVLAIVLKPVIGLLTISTNGVLRLLGIDPKEKDEPVSEEDIVIMLDAGADEGTIDSDDVEYIKNVFKLDRLTSADVMTQRNELVYVYDDMPDGDIVAIIDEEGFSRMPVCEGTLDNIVGILHAREYLLRHTDKSCDIKSIMTEPVYVPETMPLDKLFKSMQMRHNHIVIVVNEYGVMSGIVTMEDILEEIVGEIWDESDVETDSITENADGTYTVLSTASMEDFLEFFDIAASASSEASTVNGLLIEISGRIPRVGESIEYGDLIITVIAADKRMTHEVCVQKVNKNNE